MKSQWKQTAMGDAFKRVGPCYVRLTDRVGGGAVGFIVRDDKYHSEVEADSFRVAKKIADRKLASCARGAPRQWPPRGM